MSGDTWAIRIFPFPSRDPKFHLAHCSQQNALQVRSPNRDIDSHKFNFLCLHFEPD